MPRDGYRKNPDPQFEALLRKRWEEYVEAGWVPMKARGIVSDRFMVHPEGKVFDNRRNAVCKTWKTKWGYRIFNCGIEGNKVTLTVHRVIAETLVPNPHGYREVNHIDGDKENNRADNLEWCTRQYNMQHYYANNDHYMKGKSMKEYRERKKVA